MDITDPSLVAAAAARVDEAVGDAGLSALINMAGVADIAAGVLEGVPIERAHRVFDINLFGTLRVTQAFLPLLRRASQASIINTTSGNVRVPVPLSGVYMASKAAVHALTQTLRLELAPLGIEVVSIEPGGVRTPMTADARQGLDEAWERTPQELVGIYKPHLQVANDWLVDQLDLSNEPEDIAETFVRVLATKHPQPRYTAGKEVRVVPLVQRLLSERAFESLMLRTFGIRRGSR